MAEESLEQQVLKQLELIYSKENLEKDNFFREMIQQDPEGWVTLKKLSCIKRFKSLINGNIETFSLAVGLSTEFEVNEDKTKLRKIPVPEPTPEELEKQKEEREKEAQRLVETYIDAKNIRSIYAKGFDTDEQKDPIRDYFQSFGRVVSVKMRFDDNKAFKGSVFVEFETAEIAEKARSANMEYKSKPLLVMGKQEYIDMKSKEKFDGQEWAPLNDGRRQAYVIEFSGAEDMTITEIKALIAQKAKIGSVELIPEEKGRGVIQLLETIPEKFMESLEDNKLDPLTFRLADENARRLFFRQQKEGRERRNGSRGNGRGRGRGRGRGGKGGNKRERSGKDESEREAKKARSLVPEIASASKNQTTTLR
ncbi:hypothetical protein EC973_008505 [Apophysomyces ossiformis]|uniref:Uncharacterized protein n=1 Tax=Apophysomyces ossiformis TaxID=679940 RepID=A0A8H7BSI8_9FUNG|nr:hypothetical protein EC973_008505 [Apophysomyces ossiformis]